MVYNMKIFSNQEEYENATNNRGWQAHLENQNFIAYGIPGEKLKIVKNTISNSPSIIYSKTLGWFLPINFAGEEQNQDSLV